MPIPNRYKQLLASIPKGSFYASDGQVLPHRSSPYELRITTGQASREYGVFVNGNFRGLTSTNASGIALIEVQLDKGRNDLKLVDSITQAETLASITTRDYATWMAAQAETIEGIDDGVEQVLLDARLDTASASLIEDVFGKTVQTANDFAYDLDTYREFLQELRTAYRYYGSTIDGISRVVRAFTQISPLIYPRSFGPEWILGKDILSPKEDVVGRTYYTTSSLSNANGSGAGVSVVSIENTVGLGSGTLKTYGTLTPKRMTWTPPNGSEGAQVPITGNGQYTLFASDYIDGIVGYPGPFQITSSNNRLALNIDDLGLIIITLTTGGSITAATLATDINTALTADARYGAGYSSVASAYDPFTSGTPMVKLTSPNGANGGSIVIDLTTADASQTVFDIPVVRGGLQSSVSPAVSSLVLDPSVNMAYWPSPTSDDPLEMIVGRCGYNGAGVSGSSTTVLGTEVVQVTDVNKTTKTLTLANPTVFAHNANELVYINGEAPYRRETVTNTRSIAISITDYTLLPGSSVSDTVVVSGTGVPDGWIVNTNAGGSPTLTGFPQHIYFELDRDLPFNLSSDHRISLPIPDEILKYTGFPVTVSVWGRIDDPSRPTPQTTINQVGLSFDNQTSYTMVSPTILGKAVNTQWRPQQFLHSTAIVPSDTTKAWLRISTTADNGSFTIHRVRITVSGAHGGLFLGDGTIPRNEAAIKHGAFLYVWGPDPLSVAEKASLGVTSVTQSVPGHIDKIAPDSLWLDKFDVSSYEMDGTPKNIKGVFSEEGFLDGAITNLDLVLRTPSHFTYLQPVLVSEHTQDLNFVLSGPDWLATLSVISDSDQLGAILFEDGTPVLQSDWQFDDASTVHLLYTPVPGALYQLRYHALIRFESATIDLGSSYADYLWFADFHALLRPEIEPTLVKISSGVQFESNGNARLAERSNQDQSAATLTEDTGLTRRIIPVSQWSFVDAQTISISLDVFEPAALYELAYVAEVNHPKSNVMAKVELRSATSPSGLLSATYQEIDHNYPIANAPQYHQMRVTFSNVRDIRDVRLQSLVIKGLGLFGAGLSIPILRP